MIGARMLALSAAVAAAGPGTSTATPPAAPTPSSSATSPSTATSTSLSPRPSTAPACALPAAAAGTRPWRTGETLVLALDLFGVVDAGTLELAVQPPMSRGKVVPLRGRAKASTAVGSIKKLTAVALSWIDARTLRPERYRDESDEDGLHRVTDTRFPRGGGPAQMTWRIGERGGQRLLPAAGEAMDALSALYAIRAAPLAPGDRLCFEAVGRGRLWRTEGMVAAKREPVQTPAGRFDTLRVDLTAVRVDRADVAPMTVHMWLSADERRLLVAVVGELDIGPARAQLTEVRGAARPAPR